MALAHRSCPLHRLRQMIRDGKVDGRRARDVEFDDARPFLNRSEELLYLMTRPFESSIPMIGSARAVRAPRARESKLAYRLLLLGWRAHAPRRS